MQLLSLASLALAAVAVAAPPETPNLTMAAPSQFARPVASAAPLKEDNGPAVVKPEEPLAPAPANGTSFGPLPDDFPPEIVEIMNAVRTLAGEMLSEVKTLAAEEGESMNDFVSDPAITVVSTDPAPAKMKQRSLERRWAFLIPIVTTLAKGLIKGVSTLADSAKIPVVGDILKTIAQFIP